MFYNKIGVAITDQCNSECKMCCFSCNMDKRNILDIAILKNLIKQVSKKPNIKQIAFSGGEAFLHYDLLEELVYEAKKENLWVSCSTNGFWCNDYFKTKKQLQKLKKKGLSVIRTSIDIYHQKFVDIKNIKNLLRASKELNIKCFVNVGLVKSIKKKNLEIINHLGSDIFNIDVLYFPFLPIGNAEANFSNEDFYNLAHKNTLKCNYNKTIPVMANGDIYFCDSAAMINTGRSVGNIYKDSFEEIIKNIKKSPIFYLVITRGLKWFIDIIETNKLAVLQDYYVNSCHLCNDIFGNSKLYNKLIPYIEKEYQNLTKTKFVESV